MIPVQKTSLIQARMNEEETILPSLSKKYESSVLNSPLQGFEPKKWKPNSDQPTPDLQQKFVKPQKMASLYSIDPNFPKPGNRRQIKVLDPQEKSSQSANVFSKVSNSGIP